MKNFKSAVNQIFMEKAYAINLFNDVVAKSYEQTELHQAFVVNANSLGYEFNDDDRVERVIKSFFTATSVYLSKTKVAKPDEAVALILTDVSGNFKFAAIVEYHENKDNPDEPGNWSYVMTFDENKISSLEKTKSVKKLLYTSQVFMTILTTVAHDVAAISFQHQSYLYHACIISIDTLLQVLDREAKTDEVVDIEFPGYFTASVAVEDGEKIFAITPDGHMKQIIKDDTVLDINV